MSHGPLIRKLEAVEALTGAEQDAAMALCTHITVVHRHRDVVSEGDRPRHVHVILDGWAARYSLQRNGTRQITALLIPGDFCDLHATALAVMDHGIRALTECKVGLIAAEAIKAITTSTPALTRAFWRSTLVDEAILRQWLVNAGRADAYKAIGHLLCELHKRLEVVGLVEEGVAVIPLTQQDLADVVGLTSVHVNRILRRLRDDGLVALGGGQMRILDANALRRASEFDPTYLHLRPRLPDER